MGLFSGHTTIQVASTVYNMAGDAAKRPNFLKSVLFGAIMSPYESFIGETLVSQYIKGPGTTQRLFQSWAIRNDYPGLPSLKIRNEHNVNPSVVAGEITPPSIPAGLVTQVTEAFISSGSYTYFADQYVYANHPALVGTDYLSEYYVDTNEILIQYEDGSTEIISAGIYNVLDDFLIAYHYFYLGSSTASPVVGTLVTGLTDSLDLPDVTSFTLDSSVNTGIVHYDLGGGVFADFNTILSTYSKVEFIGGDGITSAVVNRTTTIQIWEYRYADGGALHPMWDHQTTTQDETLGLQVGDPEVFIYKIGSGNVVLDALQDTTTASEPEFYPLIPIRLNNVSIKDAIYSDSGNGLYSKAKAAYKKMSGNQSFDDLIKQIEEPTDPAPGFDLGDIDYAYIQYGVSLNATDNTAKEYIYRFFKGMIPYQNTSSAYMTNFASHIATYAADKAAYIAWVEAQSNTSDPLYGTAAPTLPDLTPPRVTTIQLQCADPLLSSSDMRVNWVCILENSFSGIGRTGAKKGDLWFTKESNLVWDSLSPGSSWSGTATTVTNTVEKTYLYWQNGDATYKRLTLYGMIHQNFIYGGKFVQISAHEAIDDLEESGFLVPLHRPTLKDMGMKDSTQLAMSNTYLVFNTYLVHKTHWWQTFFGMLFIIVLVLVVSILISPAAFAGVSGVFGTNIAVGVSLGLAGTSAIIAGAVANTLAAILISQVISAGSVAIFGEKWGALIGAILGFAFSFGVAGGFQNLSSFFNPKTLMDFGNALSNGMKGFAAAEVKEIQAKGEAAKTEYLRRLKEINEKSAELFGNDLSFDWTSLMTANTGNDVGIGLYRPETLDGFIQRTLMTGTDMVDLSLGFIENFTKISLTLPEN